MSYSKRREEKGRGARYSLKQFKQKIPMVHERSTYGTLKKKKEEKKYSQMQRGDKLSEMHLFPVVVVYILFPLNMHTHINEEIVVNCHTSHAIVVNHARPPVCRWLASTKLGENLTWPAVAKKIFTWHATPNYISIHRGKWPQI